MHQCLGCCEIRAPRSPSAGSRGAAASDLDPSTDGIDPGRRRLTGSECTDREEPHHVGVVGEDDEVVEDAGGPCIATTTADATSSASTGTQPLGLDVFGCRRCRLIDVDTAPGFTIHATKTLLDRVKEPLGDPVAPVAELGNLYATALFWKPQVALLVNERTLLPVFMPLAPATTLAVRFPE